MKRRYVKLMLFVVLSLAATPAGAQTFAPEELLSYEAAVSEAIDEHNRQRVQDKTLIQKRYEEDVRSIRALYAQQIKGISDRKALASYKRERDEKIRQARERRAAADEASAEVLKKQLRERKAYLRELPYRKKSFPP